MYCSQAVQDTSTWKDKHDKGSSKQTKAPLFSKHNNDDVIPPDDLEKRIEQLELKSYRAREKKRQKVEELNITSDLDTDYDTDEAESLG
ncbi:hypothetical protein Goarm_005882 [Gossypium armourianum]|uniref:Uncharacterized protein n=1 Tax=Gossypium armourianum TaxID=34283 RepID=A0A7J9JIW1_9ROSI|nr:hypothetical protein [Gossypium armourianum]